MPNYPDLNTRYLDWKRREKGFKWHRAGKPKPEDHHFNNILWASFTAIILFGIFFLIFSLFAKVARAEEIDLTIIAQIESSGNPLAYNLNSKARGLYQITPICLKDYVQMNDIFYADPDYLFNPAFNTKVANWYFNKRIPQLLKHFNKSVTLENVLWAYNAGIGKVIKGNMPKETKDYIAKYKRLAGAK